MIIIKNTLKREFFHYFKFGNFLILYNAVGHAKMKHATDVRISKSPAFSSMNNPPINVPTALFMLLMKRYAPFANSGASLIDEPNQYWEIVCIEPSIMPKNNCKDNRIDYNWKIVPFANEISKKTCSANCSYTIGK